MTDLGVEALLPLRGLTALNLGCCHRLTDASAGMVAAGLRGLRALDLRDTAITDAGVRRLAAGLPHLRRLNLEHCAKVKPKDYTLKPKTRKSTAFALGHHLTLTLLPRPV